MTRPSSVGGQRNMKSAHSILTLTDARGVTQYRYYPITGRLHEKENPDGTVETYAYDQYGRLHSRSIGVESWTYGYDTLSRLSTVTRSNGDITTYAWTVQGNLDTVTDFAGGVTRHTYDWRGRLTGIETKNAQNIVETRFTYELDDAGNRTAVTVLDGTRTAYTYNDLNYLIMETVHTGADTFTTYYTYTDGGSILTKETDTGTVEYFYDTTGKLTRTEERDLNGLLLTETAYQYDDNGNTVAVVTDGAALAYGYDRENRLTTVTGTGTNVLYTYDGEGNRVRKSVNGLTTNYLVDTSYANAQVAAEYDDSGTVQAVYHRGLGLISMTQGAAERFYRYDAQGSIRAISNGTAVTDTYTFDAYGNTTGRTGTTANAYQYTGEQRDEETGNYYLRARYYNPGAGQFISRDSWEGDIRNPITLNKYAYANSNPAMYTDPSGHEGIMEVIATQKIVETDAATAFGMSQGIPSPEQTAKLDEKELFRNRYYLLDISAAWDATNFINPLSVATNWEYGGWVMQLKGSIGLFYAINPSKGIKEGGSWDPDANLPKGNNIKAAIYHTHGDKSIDAETWQKRCESDPMLMICKYPYSDNRERFSEWPEGNDIRTLVKNNVNGYLGTPRGWFWKYDRENGAKYIPAFYTRVSSPYLLWEDSK